MSNRVRVVAAIIIRDGRILLTQRKASDGAAFRWETPGGKVDGGEGDAEALRRELREELGVECEVVGFAFEGIFDPPWTPLPCRVVHYHVKLPTKIQPLPLEAEGIGWFEADELLGLRCCASLHEAKHEVMSLVRTVN